MHSGVNLGEGRHFHATEKWVFQHKRYVPWARKQHSLVETPIFVPYFDFALKAFKLVPRYLQISVSLEGSRTEFLLILISHLYNPVH